MKINEKSLLEYAYCNDGIEKEGFLQKKGEVNHSYKRRWFTLKGNLLFYFDKPGDKQALGVIIVENCSVEISDCDKFSFCIRFQDSDGPAPSRTYVLCAESEREMEKWMKAITSSSYNYAQMVVKEFEKTLHRLKSEMEDFSSKKSKKTNSIEKESSRLKHKSVKTRHNTGENKCEQTFDQVVYDSGEDDSQKSTFEFLHTTYGASIWTKISAT